jgi:succinate-acetate transporter protein
MQMNLRRAHLYENDSKPRIENVTRINLKPLASPLPLAFFAFGTGSVMQSAQQLGLIPQQESFQLAFVFGAFVFPSLALAAVFAFLARETLGATAIGLISVSWLCTALILYTYPPPTISSVLGLLDLILAVVLLLLAGTAVTGKPLLGALIVVAVARYGLNGIYELSAISGVQTASGFVGLAIFMATLYGGLAFGIEDTQHRTVLPIGRRGEARQAIEDDLTEQIGPVAHEAGVRKQL